MKAGDFDNKFDGVEDVTADLELSSVNHPL